MTEPQHLRIGAAQVAEVYLDREATIEKDCRYIRKAGEMDVDLLVFPEFHVPASPHWYRYDEEREFRAFYESLFENAVTIPGDATDALCEAAREAGTAVVMGVTEKEADTAGTMYNTLVFIDADGRLLGSRRKLKPTLHERLFHTGGTGEDVRCFESSQGTLGGLMCGEHTNPLAVFSTLACGEQVHAAAWPAFPWRNRETRERRIGIRTRYHAFVGGVPTVSATSVVTEALVDELGQEWEGGSGGTSSIILPSGEYAAGPKYQGEGIVHAEIDMKDRVRSKATHDILGHYNRFDVFDLTVDTSAHHPLTRVPGDEDPSSSHSDPD